MTAIVSVGVVVLLVLLGGLLFRRRPRARFDDPRRVSRALHVSEQDIAELTALGHQIEEEFGFAPATVLLHQLSNVVRRRVPVRAVRPGPSQGLARICFADGTVFQVRGRQLGDLGRLAVTAMRHPVWLVNYHRDRAQVVMDIGWSQGEVSVVAIGIDQAD